MRGHGETLGIVESTVSACVQAAVDAGAKAVVVLARTGATAQLFSKYKLPMPVIVVTCFDYVARQSVALIPGCQAVHTPQYTNYGYNNAAGDDESQMVAEGTKHAAEIGVITKADDIVCAVHAYKAGATKNVAMRFYYAGAAL